MFVYLFDLLNKLLSVSTPNQKAPSVKIISSFKWSHVFEGGDFAAGCGKYCASGIARTHLELFLVGHAIEAKIEDATIEICGLE